MSEFEAADYSGYLKKKGGINKAYKRRWFELRGKTLYYFKSQGNKRPAGFIVLEGAQIEDDSTKKHSFKVRGSSLARIYELTSDSEDEKQAWIAELKKVVNNDWFEEEKKLQEKKKKQQQESGEAGAPAGSGKKGAGAGAGAADDEDEEEVVFAKENSALVKAGGDSAASASSAASAAAKKKVGLEDFDLIKVIGRGSFGKVMKVRHKATGNIYAMKVLKKDMIIKENMLSHTLSEKKILEMINHPFICTLHYAFQTKEKLYLVLTFLAGGELFFHLKEETKFDVERAKFYAAEIVLAIEHLHKHDIIYRDLKPENCVLNRRGDVCLTDFGLAKTSISNSTPTYTFCGTPEYLAPEILKGQGHAKAVDWWSLGILLYEMLVGLPPFYSENINEMYELILKAPLKFPSFVPPEAQSLLRGLLEREEFKRLGAGPTDAAEIRAHPFFSSINWDDLQACKLPPPFVPDLGDDANDTRYFDDEFTSESVRDSVAEVTEDVKDGSFDSFDFGGRN